MGRVPETFDLFEHMDLLFREFDTVREVPDIIEFITSPHWLDRPNLYPRQATLLKIIFLQDDLFTDFDFEVIDEWTKGFTLNSVGPSGLQTMDSDGNLSDVTTVRYQGDWGIQPDIYRRIEMLKDRGYHWFTLILQVLGRRSGKGYIGGICAAYVLWHYVSKPDVRAAYGIDKSKRLACQVFAGKKMQARDNQWRDIVNVIMDAPCFQKYISESLTDTLTVYSSKDRSIEALLKQRKTTMDMATFELVPKEATTMAGRGPASFMQFYDEMAHMVNLSGGSRSAEEVWEAATPALDQFKQDAFRYCASSPWQMTGQFYTLCQQALEIDASNGEPIYPDSLICQLASWDLYEDWKRTLHNLPARYAYTEKAERWKKDDDGVEVSSIVEIPHDRINFTPLVGAIQEYDEAMQRLERANAETFRVERRSKWAAVMDAYFPTEHVRRMFRPYHGDFLPMRREAAGGFEYVMHGDPGKTGSNFGFCVAHKEDDPEGGIPHVVIDYVHGWQSGDFPNTYSLPDTAPNEMDYIAIEAEIMELIGAFLPSYITLDQWNSIGMLQRMARYAREVSYKTVIVEERTATAPLNWKTAETMKIALSLNKVHSPIYDLFELECTFLRKMPGDKVDHPETGPCTTKDVYDAVSACVYQLIGADVSRAYGEEFSALGVHVAGQGQSLSGGGSIGGQPSGLAPNSLTEIGAGFSNYTKESQMRRNQQGSRGRNLRRSR